MEHKLTKVDESLEQWIRGVFDSYYGDMPDNPCKYYAFEAVDNGKRVGAIKFKLFSNWIQVEYLVVIKEENESGIGATLLQKAEDFAKDKGCIGSMLTTISYQTPDFYKKRGYEAFAEVEPYAKAHKKIFLKKLLNNE